ncbi:hypothetical protein WA026_004174 [Henosepilachna vigintioctopunctata]|uniref:Reverse transcriptase domain-containing protein n=1 Tax=Henosepilachna vigintioctopunctata TaxID=420089 RepID=A0AAW1UEX0_9CUCU
MKACLEEVAKPVTFIINNSLKYGIFPEELKSAIVKPIYKKGDKEEMENYRPISLLPAFSKLFELVISKQLISFLSQHSILSTSQHAYIKGYSTQTAIYEFIANIVHALEDSDIAIGLFLDLSRAFDSLNHGYIFKKMEQYGIRGTSLEWFKSYLHFRTQTVSINTDTSEVNSETLPIEFGVPQGSILGPIIFIIFINDLSDKLTNNHVSVINYADDTNILLRSTNCFEATQLTMNTLSQANEWFINNQLCMNKQKTQATLFKTSHASFVTPKLISVQGEKLNLDKTIKLLGVWMDESLKWNKHIEELSKRLSSNCYSLGVLNKYLDKESLKIVYQASFESRIRYGCMFYGNASNIDNVARLQKRALRYILKMKSADSCRGKFCENGLLTIAAIHIQECLLFLFKNKHRFEQKTSTEYNTRTTQLKYPAHKLAFTERCPEYMCTRYFNKIRPTMRAEKNIKKFKSLVYEMLLKMEPYSVKEFLDYNMERLPTGSS